MMKFNDVQNTILAAYALILRKRDWVQKMSASTSKDPLDVVPATSTDARCWCASGAILAVAPTLRLRRLANRTLFRVATQAHGLGYVLVNDVFGHKAILKVMELAVLDAARYK